MTELCYPSFDPSKGVWGYSLEKYARFLSLYSKGLFQTKSQGQAYYLLSLLTLKQGIKVPFFEHYTPSKEYTEAQLQRFYEHYGLTTRAQLEDLHVHLESLYPLDPSFAYWVKELKRTRSPEVIQALLPLFGVVNEEELFTRFYQITDDLPLDPDLNWVKIASEPEQYLIEGESCFFLPERTVVETFSSYPYYNLTKRGEDYLSLQEQARRAGINPEQSLLSLYIALGKTLPPDLVKYLSLLEDFIIPTKLLNHPVGQVLARTTPLSRERDASLRLLPEESLSSFVELGQIPTFNALSGSSGKLDLLGVLSVLTVPSEESPTLDTLSYERIDPYSPNAYSVAQLTLFLKLLGYQGDYSDPVLTANDLYFALLYPRLTKEGDLFCYYDQCYSEEDLLQSFSEKQSLQLEGWYLSRESLTSLLPYFTNPLLLRQVQVLLTQPLTQEERISLLEQLPNNNLLKEGEETTYPFLLQEVIEQWLVLLEVISEGGQVNDLSDPVSDKTPVILALNDLTDLLADYPTPLGDLFLGLLVLHPDLTPTSSTLLDYYRRLIEGVALTELEQEQLSTTLEYYSTLF